MKHTMNLAYQFQFAFNLFSKISSLVKREKKYFLALLIGVHHFFSRFTKILILEKRLKAHFNFLSKVHSVFHHYLFPQDNLSHPTFPLAKSIVRMNQNLNFK